MRAATTRTIISTLVSAALCGTAPAHAAGQWLDVQDTNLEISAGNALDFSGLFGPVDLDRNNPANKRVGLNTQGNTSLDGNKPYRFLCAAMNFAGPWEDIPDRAGAQRIATQLVRHGYNLLRLHHVEGMLMEGVEKSPDNDFKFNAAKQARLYDFLAVMKANGMHWMLDIVTDDTAAWGMVGKDRAANNKDFRTKLFVHYDPANQAHWKGIVDRLYDQDYDGAGPAGTILRDPALASANLFNELTLVYNIRKMPGDLPPDALKDEMIAWAAKRNPPVTLTREDIPSVSDPLSPYAGLLLEFFTYKERRTVRWMEPYVRSRAAPELLLSAYNNGKVIQALASRDHMDAVNIHGYHDAEGRPNKSRNNSSFSDSLNYLQYFAAHRYAKKPLFVDEYDIPYWNKWRREAGIAPPAYASLQGWDCLCRYSNPVTLEYRGIRNVPRTNRIYPFSIGMDPIARAGETLSALLFRRGDVRPSPNVFTINYSDSFFHDQSSGNENIPSSITRLALLSKIVAKRTYANSPKPLKYTFTPDPSLIGLPAPDQEAPWRTHFAKWQAAIPGNPSYMSADAEHYVSDTGQLITHIETPRGPDSVHHMSVRTPRTEAYVFQAAHLPPTQSNDRLVIESADTDALVSLSSIDPLKTDGTGNTLAASNRLLMIVATDALNSDAVFDTENRGVLVDLGELPVRLEAITLQVAVRLNPDQNYRVYPLDLNGDRRPKAGGGFQTLPTQTLQDGSGFRLQIDTAALGAPTTFFEIERR